MQSLQNQMGLTRRKLPEREWRRPLQPAPQTTGWEMSHGNKYTDTTFSFPLAKSTQNEEEGEKPTVAHPARLRTMRRDSLGNSIWHENRHAFLLPVLPRCRVGVAAAHFCHRRAACHCAFPCRRGCTPSNWAPN